MKQEITAQMVSKLLELLPTDVAKHLIDDLLDCVEEYVEQTENTVDDALLPAIEWFRRVIDIPDDIGGDED